MQVGGCVPTLLRSSESSSHFLKRTDFPPFIAPVPAPVPVPVPIPGLVVVFSGLSIPATIQRTYPSISQIYGLCEETPVDLLASVSQARTH